MSISVVIPVYNAAAYLDRAILSVLEQSVHVDEIIVVDDGSTEDIQKIALHYAQIKYLSQPNSGVSAARNHGIKAANCEWICFLDADDEWYPSKIAEQLSLLNQFPEVRWMNCRSDIYSNGVLLPSPKPSFLGNDSNYFMEPFFKSASAGIFFQTSGAMIHRSIFKEIGVFDVTLEAGEDRDMWWRIAMKHPEFGYASQLCYRYNASTPNSLMKKSRDRSNTQRA
jgi:glycosyltransferase involved in cell wall biosynthesis